MSEYVPYFRRTPELIDRHTDERMWGVQPQGDQPRGAPRRVEEAHGSSRKRKTGDWPMATTRSPSSAATSISAASSTPPRPNALCVQRQRAQHGADHQPATAEDAGDRRGADHGRRLRAASLLRRRPAPRPGRPEPQQPRRERTGGQGLLDKDRESIYRAVQLDPLTSLSPCPRSGRWSTRCLRCARSTCPFRLMVNRGACCRERDSSSLALVGMTGWGNARRPTNRHPECQGEGSRSPPCDSSVGEARDSSLPELQQGTGSSSRSE